MDTELLRAFVAVAEGKSFSHAGRTLHRTQSAVSLQIQRLEERLGQPLFERTSRRVTLTVAGSRLLPQARRILRLEERIARELSGDDTQERIRLGITEEQAMAYLPTVLPALAQAHPHVQIELVCQLSTALIAHFDEGLLDVVLNIWHSPSSHGEVIGREPLIWAGNEQYRPTTDQPLSLALNPEGCIFRAYALRALERAERAYQIRYTSQSPTGINQPVQSGLAVTLKTSRSLPSGCVDVGALLDLPPLGVVDIELHRGPVQLSEALDRLCELLRAAVCRNEEVHTIDR